jgi:outer membrane protein assembly factor BamB
LSEEGNMSSPREHSQSSAFSSFVLLALFLHSIIASATPSISLSKKSGPPTSRILVSGRGFEANVGVDIFFDTKDKALVVTNGKGEFHDAGIYAPRSAHPGKHWVTALERNNDKGAQKPFLVRTDWSQFHFSPDLDGLNPYENVLSPHTASRLGLKWSFPTHYYVYSPPVVVGGVVYIGSVKDSLYALKTSTGAELWVFPTNGRVLDAAAVSNGRVFVGAELGDLYALRASDGKELWHIADFSGGAATVVGDVVYVGNLANQLCAIGAKDGHEQWCFDAGRPLNDISAPAVVNGTVYAGSTDGNVYAVDAATGGLLWSYATNGYVDGPAVVNGVVYAPSWDNNLYALDSATGFLLWKFATGGSVTCTPAVADGVVYLGSNDGNVYALDATTGAERWRVLTGPCYGSSPALANGVVYIGGNQYVFALDAATGKNLWTFATGNTVQSSPAVVDGRVYVGSTDENVYGFGLADEILDSMKQAAPSGRPDLMRLHPDLRLKVVRPGVTRSSN